MAQLYKARQASLDRIVAIKFLSAEFLWDPEAKLLFEQESLVIAQLNHPNIVHIIDRGLSKNQRPYFVMEYIHGKELSTYMKENRLSDQKKMSFLVQICKAMACAHKNGVIHRDIKPANILIDNNEHVYVLDFGIAWLAANGHPEDIVGTPAYMSPEQFSAPESVSCLSDIYSLGVIMYEMFLHQNPAPYLDDLKGSMSGLPAPLQDLIYDCLQTKPKNRPQSADEIRLRLLKIMQGAHIDARQKTAAQTLVGKTKNKFILLDVIKRDQYGDVYLFEDREKHNLLVIKKRVKTDAGFKESTMLKHIKHKNIIHILGTSRNKNAFIVVMEHLPGSSLQDRLSRPYTLDKFKRIALSICSAMQYAHKHKIMHGNLRPSNILFDGQNQIKITDFGFDEHYQSKPQLADWYQCPDPGASPVERDMFSAAAIFYHMLTGSPVRFDHGRIQADKQFNELDINLKKLLRGMMERKTPSSIKTFKQAYSSLKKISRIHRKPAERKRPVLKHIFLFMVLSGTILAGSYIYTEPDIITYLSHETRTAYTWLHREAAQLLEYVQSSISLPK